tara:strand:+ start:188 stop:412 length:225 start_codon:yes stop_codon:yes gene_type:complete
MYHNLGSFGDNSDVFPDDSSEWIDSDGDGYGDNRDWAPFDAEVWDKPADYKITYVSAIVVAVIGVLFYTTKRHN